MKTTRRNLVSGASAFAIASCTHGANPSRTVVSSRPPSARIETVSETVHGIAVTDPYRWMENQADPRFEPYMRAQADHARAVLYAIPGRERLRQRLEQLSGGLERVGRIQRAGGFVFIGRQPSGADQARLYVRDADGSERLLVDPAALRTGDQHVSLDWWVAAPSGAYVCFGASAAGSEDSVIQVIETATGRILPDRISRGQFAFPAWTSDSAGFTFIRLAEGARRGAPNYFQNAVCYLHRVNTDASTDQRLLARGQFAEVPVEESDFPKVYLPENTPYAFAATFSGVRPNINLYTALQADVLAGRPRWRRLCAPEDGVTAWVARGEQIYLLSFKDAPRFKVLRLRLDRNAFSDAEVVVPMSARVVTALALASDGVYLTEIDGGVDRLRRLSWDDEISEVPLPFDGSIGSLLAQASAPGIDFRMQGWVRPNVSMRYEPAAGVVRETNLVAQPNLDLSAYEYRRFMVRARDGVEVPVSIIHRRDTRLDGTNPLLANCYASYGEVIPPNFEPRRLAFVEQGGVFAFVHARGGGEFGREWHRAGLLETKPNTWRDLIDCCEALIAAGYTHPTRLAIQGQSAGGIAVGRAMTERPELFAAVISQVGVSNTWRHETGPLGSVNVPEFGTLSTPEGARILYETDSYLHVRDGVSYPAVLLTAGMTDTRVDPWQGGKMAARLQAATASDRPVLLRVEFDAGHGIGSTRAQLESESADIAAFALWQTGAPGFQPR